LTFCVAEISCDFAGCSTGRDVDESRDPLPREGKMLNDAEQYDCIVQSADCSEAVDCVTVSAVAVESLQFEVSVATAERSLESNNMMSGDADVTATVILSHNAVGCGSAVHRPAEYVSGLQSSVSEGKAVASDRELGSVAVNNSSVSSYSEGVDAAGQKTADSSSAELSRRSCSSVEAKSGRDGEHDANIRGLSRKCSNQSSIRSFFQPVSKAQETESTVHSTKNSGQSVLSHSRDVMLCGNVKTQNSCDSNVDSRHSTSKSVVTESSDFTSKTRKCPFYKWIPGKTFGSFRIRYCSCVIVVCIAQML